MGESGESGESREGVQERREDEKEEEKEKRGECGKETFLARKSSQFTASQLAGIRGSNLFSAAKSKNSFFLLDSYCHGFPFYVILIFLTNAKTGRKKNKEKIYTWGWVYSFHRFF